MSLKLQILQANDILITTPEGDLDLEQAQKIIAEIVSLENIPGEHMILFDARETHIELSITDIWNLARELAKHRKAFQRRFAVLVPDSKLEDAQFFETASRNLGFVVHATTDFEDAIRWLAKIDDLQEKKNDHELVSL